MEELRANFQTNTAVSSFQFHEAKKYISFRNFVAA